MALVQKISPKGIDLPIARLQTALYSGLTWSTGGNTYQSYERAYKNEKDGSKLPEVFMGNSDTGKNEYREVFNNDDFSASSFFLASDNRTGDDLITSDVDIVFQLDLKKLYPLIVHRADEEAHQDVTSILFGNVSDYKVTNIITGVSNVYADLNLTKINPDDMHPFHVFKVTMEVYYNMIGC